MEIVKDNLNTFKDNGISPISLAEWQDHWYRKTFMTDKNVISNRTLKMVTNEKELEDAIGSNTTIILNTEKIKISNHPINRLHSLSNLAIISNFEHTLLTSKDAPTDIMSITNCKNILLSGLDLYREEVLDRNGSSLSLVDCVDVELVGCELSGYTRDGLNCESTNKLVLTDCEIHHAQRLAINIIKSSYLIFNTSNIYFTEKHILVSESKHIDFNLCKFDMGAYEVMDINNSTNLRFDRCNFSNNQMMYDIGKLTSSGNIVFSNCNFIENEFLNSSETSLFKIKFSESEEDEGLIVFEDCEIGNKIWDFSDEELLEITDTKTYAKRMEIRVERFSKEKNEYVKTCVDLEEDEPTIIEKYKKRVKRPYQPYD